MNATVHLWLVDLRTVDAGRGLPLLSTAERERVGRAGTPLVRRRLVCRRAALRSVLAPLAGVAPADLELERRCDRCGKHHPVDLRRGTGGRLWWSSSSAGALFVVAGADAPIGVDVEPVRPAAEWAAVARRHFAAEEIAALAGSAERFARYWTLKEAYLKGLGLGLLGGLDRLRCDTLTSEADGWLVAPGHPEWRFAAVPLPDGGVACAVALRGRAAVPEVHRYAPVVEPGRRS